jgi:ATPase subunit of ABC transporter with duplicated ATPase domains
MKPYIALCNVDIATPGGRPLFAGLSLRLHGARVALVGRNGVGKSTLLATLASTQEAGGQVRGRVCFVPQLLPRDRSLSHGEQRRRELERAAASGADIVLLDEPSEDLDEDGVAWLRGWLRDFSGCLVVATHDRRLLEDFRDFFVASETGCRAFTGTVEALDVELERDHQESQLRYLRGLHRLEAQEAHTLHVARRKARKKRYGRCSELDRATPRIRLNQKRGDAQASHGKLARQRAERLDAARTWTRTLRRSMAIELPFVLPMPTLPPEGDTDVVELRGVTAVVHGRVLFESLDLRVGRDRIAVVGENGSGKTTLLEIMRGVRAPDAGVATRDLRRIASIAQGGADWMHEESLLERLRIEGRAASLDAIAETLVAHRFPLALAERPLRSLSPGERVRAAFLCILHQSTVPELLLLDEPTFSLDRVGQNALARALRAWPGGLVVASHDRAFLDAIAPTRTLNVAREARASRCLGWSSIRQ